MRRIARRSKSSSRGGIVVQLPGWTRSRIVFFESRLELNVLYVLLARGGVVDVWEQPPSISYRDATGKRRNHFFDFLIGLKSGRRIAVAVKPAKIAARLKFVSDLKCIRQEMRKDFADAVLLITDQDFTKAEAQNAERYVDFARHRNADNQQNLRDRIKSTSFPTTVGALAASLDAGGMNSDRCSSPYMTGCWRQIGLFLLIAKPPSLQEVPNDALNASYIVR